MCCLLTLNQQIFRCQPAGSTPLWLFASYIFHNIYTHKEMLYGRKTAEVRSTLLTPVLGVSAEQWMDRSEWARREGPSSASQNCRKTNALQLQPLRSVLVAHRNCRNYFNVTIFGVAVLESHSGNFFRILTFFPIAQEAAEPWCQRCWPKGLIAWSAGSDSARAALCESLLWLRSFKSRLSFPFLWEQKWVSRGKFWKRFSDVCWSNQSKWQNFITTSSACWLFLSFQRARRLCKTQAA